MGQLFRGTEKLMSEHKEITGVRTIDFKDATWMSTSLLCEKACQFTKAKLTSSPGKSKWYSEKNSLLEYESNRWYADGVRVEKFPRNHSVGPPREDF